ncbi:MAG: acyltransferase family protein, partial [Lachnospiraceae bacterium]|nr:acyltransferase family protein [Lachnospiraceae bacterium]
MQRKTWADILRIAATAAVMLLHISAHRWDSTELQSYDWQALNLWNSLSRWGVPVFTMISGSLFLNSDRSPQTIFRKNLVRIVASFVFWSALYAFVRVYLTGNRSFFTFAEQFVYGAYHLGFLYMIAGLYLLIPLLRKIREDRALTKYFLLLGLVFGFLVPQLISILTVFAPDWGNLFQGAFSHISMHFVISFPFYFVLGSYLSEEDFFEHRPVLFALSGVAGFLCTVLGTVWISFLQGKPSQMFYGYFSLNVLLESVFVFCLFRKAFGKRDAEGKGARFAAYLSDRCFGAYLVHVLVL